VPCQGPAASVQEVSVVRVACVRNSPEGVRRNEASPEAHHSAASDVGALSLFAVTDPVTLSVTDPVTLIQAALEGKLSRKEQHLGARKSRMLTLTEPGLFLLRLTCPPLSQAPQCPPRVVLGYGLSPLSSSICKNKQCRDLNKLIAFELDSVVNMQLQDFRKSFYF
jgi:hypothetical protein